MDLNVQERIHVKKVELTFQNSYLRKIFHFGYSLTGYSQENQLRIQIHSASFPQGNLLICNLALNLTCGLRVMIIWVTLNMQFLEQGPLLI